MYRVPVCILRERDQVGWLISCSKEHAAARCGAAFGVCALQPSIHTAALPCFSGAIKTLGERQEQSVHISIITPAFFFSFLVCGRNYTSCLIKTWLQNKFKTWSANFSKIESKGWGCVCAAAVAAAVCGVMMRCWRWLCPQGLFVDSEETSACCLSCVIITGKAYILCQRLPERRLFIASSTAVVWFIYSMVFTGHGTNMTHLS